MTDPKKPDAGAKPADEPLTPAGQPQPTDPSLDSAATMLGVRVPAEIDGVAVPDASLDAATMLGVRVPAEIDGVEPSDPALAGETLMLNRDAPAKGDPALANETVMLTPNLPAQADATVNFDAGTHGASADGEATAKRAPAAASKPGKRPLQDLVDDAELADKGARKAPPPEHTILGDKARTQNGMQMVAAAALLLIAVIGVAKFGFSRTATPSAAELQLLYPFGLDGKVLPNGHRAPGVDGVTFTFAHADDCNGERCVTYALSSGDLGFHYEMVVQKDGDLWKLVSSGPGHVPAKRGAKR